MRYGVKRLFRFPSRTRDDVRDDVAEEFRFHLDMRTEELINAGLSPDDARAQATREFGDERSGARVAVTHQERLERRYRIARLRDDLRHDLVYAWRALRRAPAFAATAVGVLALGIGATTALFSVLSGVLLRPLPYPDAGRLVEVWGTTSDGGQSRLATALPDYRAWRDGNRSFDALGAFSGSSVIISGTERPEFVQAATMTASMWAVLAAQPMLGRTFSGADEEWGRHRVAVVSENLWKRRFGSDPKVVGSQIQIGPQAFTILGVMPASFGIIGLDAEMWVPMAFPPGSVMDTRRNRFSSVLGRLKPGVTARQARDDLSLIAARLAQEEPQFNAGRGVDLDSWQDTIVGPVRQILVLLFGAVAFVMLIVCANLANLLIARATAREHELRMRATLGASRGRLIRQVLTETLVLAVCGAAVGIGIAVWLIRQIPTLGPIGLPRLNEVTIDGTVAAFAVGLTLVTALVFGLWPSRHASRVGGIGGIHTAPRTIAGGRMQQRTRRALVVAEVSLSLVLLIGATLMIVSLQRLQHVDRGFDADRVFTAIVNRYRPDGREIFVQQFVDQVAAIPGVRAAAATTSLPLSGGAWTKQFHADGEPEPRSMADVPNVNYHHVTPGYFESMGAAMRRGRPFTPQDRANQPLVAIVNDTLAQRIWPDEDPIGKRISMFPPASLGKHLLPLPGGAMTFPHLTIVGVVADLRHQGLDQAPNASVFVPLAQGTLAGAGDQIQGFHYIVARTMGDPLAVASAVEDAAREHDRNAAVSDVRTMESRVSDSIARRRFAMLLLSGFAALSVVLAVVGLYGVMSYTVSQRGVELGVRAAVGASAASLLRLVMADGLRMTLAGAAIGLLLAGALSNLMTSQLFEVKAIQVSVYASMTVALIGVASLACWIPAVRAAGVDPVTALRSE
jgi:putative ABC transport system permease protein